MAAQSVTALDDSAHGNVDEKFRVEWASSSAKEVPLTAEKVGIGPKLVKFSGGVKLDIFKRAAQKWP